MKVKFKIVGSNEETEPMEVTSIWPVTDQKFIVWFGAQDPLDEVITVSIEFPGFSPPGNPKIVLEQVPNTPGTRRITHPLTLDEIVRIYTT